MSYSLSYTQSLYLLLYVSDKIQQGMMDFIPTQQISTDLNIPPSSASSILRRLNRAQLIETREGASGGVRLTRTPREITLLDVFNAVEHGQPLFQTQFQLAVTGVKPAKAQTSIREMLGGAEQAMKQYLSGITIQDLIDAINR